MRASYWARWACSGQVADLPELILPYLIEEGYELLSNDPCRQAFDRGGLSSKIAWGLDPSQGAHIPLNLTVTYSYSPIRTIANFYWKLAARPWSVGHKEQALFVACIQRQLDRIIARLDGQVTGRSAGPVAEMVRDNDGLHACCKSAGQYPKSVCLDYVTAAATSRTAPRHSLDLCSIAAHTNQAVRCDLCHRLTVPLPGTSNRYFCLTCRHHVPYAATIC